MEQKKKESILMKDGVSYLVPFILITKVSQVNKYQLACL